MGNRPNAILAYGYDLGGGQADWEFEIVGVPPTTTVDWFREGTDRGIAEQIEAVLRSHDSILVEEHGYADEPSYALAAYVERSDWDGPREIPVANLEFLRRAQNWDETLRAAIESLGVEPNHRPRWLLLAHGVE